MTKNTYSLPIDFQKMFFLDRNQEQTEVECNLEIGRKLTCEISELKRVVRSSTDSNNELKNALKLSQTESSFLRQLVEKSENEFKETHEQQLAAVWHFIYFIIFILKLEKT